MLKLLRHVLVSVITLLCALTLHAAEPGGEKLNSTQIIEVFSGRTSLCIKEKDQSGCSTFMSERGRVKRFTYKDKKQKTGKWHAAGHQLCILWDGKTRELCFDIYETPKGEYQLFKKGKLKATVTGFEAGDTSGF